MDTRPPSRPVSRSVSRPVSSSGSRRPRSSPQMATRNHPLIARVSRSLAAVSTAFAPRPLTGKRRIRRTRSGSQLSVNSPNDDESAVDKWRRVGRMVKTIVTICRVMERYASQTKSDTERSFFELHLHLQEDLSKLVAFNPQVFRGSSSYVRHVGDHIRSVLSKPTQERDDAHIKTMLGVLRWNTAIQNYPQPVRVGICKSAVYQRYGSGRILLRQGYPAEAFYIITSGRVIVNVKEDQTGEVETAASSSSCSSSSSLFHLGPGDSFGEVALLNDTLRASTVVCKTDVELLVIMKEDFNRMIKEPMQQQRRNNLLFLRKLPPFTQLPMEFEQELSVQYQYRNYSKGAVIVEKSSSYEYLVVIKSGDCQVVTGVHTSGHSHNRQVDHQLQALFPLVADKKKYEEENAKRCHAHSVDWETGLMRDTMKANVLTGMGETLLAQNTTTTAQQTQRVESWLLKNKTLSRKYSQLEARKKQIFSSLPTSVKIHDDRLIPDRFADAGKQKEKVKQVRRAGIGRTLMRVTAYARRLQVDLPAAKPDVPPEGYAQVARLDAGAIFGLETLFQTTPPFVSLLSQGAECLLVPKKLFVKYCTASALSAVSDMVISFPSNTYIQHQLTENRKWKSYKRHLVTEVVKRTRAT